MPIAVTLRRADLLQKCIQVIESFDPKRTTVDAYAEDAAALKDKNVGDGDKKFVHQVFYGCARYQKFLRLFVTSFLYKCPAVALRSEQTLYMVLAYLTFFMLEELGVAGYRLFLTSGIGTAPALLALLQYALSVEELERWVKEEWCKLYDTKYVEQDIIGKLQSFADELRPVVSEVEFKATGTVKAGDGSGAVVRERRATSPKPFNLTQPRPRLIPEPEVISRQVKALPVPSMIHNTSLDKVEEEKRNRLEEEKAKVVAKYSPADLFSLETAKRRSGNELEELSKKVDAQRMAECTFKPKVKGRYQPPTEEAVVRQNTAAVLREDALLKQKQAKEYQILKRYEEDLHDASDFHRWQQEMKEKDHLEEEQRVHQRIIEMQLARENAIEAYESQVRRKAIIAEHQRNELKIGLEDLELELQVELEAKQKLVHETIEDREKVRVAEQEVVKARTEAAERVRKEKEAEFERKRLEDEQEMERRKDLIRQIRALERVPVERFKVFDPAEPPCQGLLEEMSLAELRERLKIVQAQHAQEVEEKRERQLEKKFEKQQELTEKVETLAKIRERAKIEALQKHESRRQKQQEVEEQQRLYREKCIEEVAERIQMKKKQKREEELRLKKELKEISTKRQFLAANAEMVEAKAHAEQHAGLDREARCRQKDLLLEQRMRNEVRARELSIRRENKQNEMEEYRQMQAAADDRLRRAKLADASLKDEILHATVSARNTQRTLARRVFSEFGHSSNLYIQRMTARMATSV